jgi:ankyrin repeat protein
MMRLPIYTAGLLVLAVLGPASAGPLHDAVIARDGALMQQLLRDGANINEQNEAGETPLFLAAKGGWYSGHDQLLVAGADVSIRDRGGYTVLHAAARAGEAGVVAGQIGVDHRSRRVDLDDHANDRGVTALFLATEANEGDIVAYLATHGAIRASPMRPG